MNQNNSKQVLPALALTFNAFAWGTSWYPFRLLEARGLHPLWATVFIYTLSCIVIVMARPHAVAQVMRTPALWLLVLASGTTNAAFNWAIVIGDVVRVVLLFYLMPLWAVLFARLLLGERLTLLAGVRVLLAIAGAAIVLWPEAGGRWPVPASLADWLGVVGGFSFALNNVMLRREAHRSDESRALAMFAGGVLVAGVLACALATGGQLGWPPAPSSWGLGVALLGAFFLLSNFALQYGAARLTASATAVILLTEVLFAAGSALLLGGGTLTPPLAIGGSLILVATLLPSAAGVSSR